MLLVSLLQAASSSTVASPASAEPTMDWERIVTVLFSGGVTGASIFALMLFMLSTGRLLTAKSHENVLTAVKDSHQSAVDAIKESHKTALDSCNERIEEYRLETIALREAVQTERARGDELQVRMSEEVVPLVRISNSLLKGLRAGSTGDD